MRLFLHPDGSLDGVAPHEVQRLGWVHDPDDLVPSPVDNAFAFLAERPDEQRWADRADVRAFDGAVTDADLDLVGGVTLTATVDSDGPRMDVFVRLLDVHPEGAAHLVARGQVHIVDTAQPRTIQVDLGQVGYRLSAGHRLRVQVSSSDYPEFVPQPGTGEHPWLATSVVANRQSIELGGPGAAVLTVHVLTDRTGR